MVHFCFHLKQFGAPAFLTVDLPWTIPVLMMEPILEWVWFTIPVFTVTNQRRQQSTTHFGWLLVVTRYQVGGTEPQAVTPENRRLSNLSQKVRIPAKSYELTNQRHGD